MTDSEKLAKEFAEKYGVTFKVGKKEWRKYFPDDNFYRWVFNCTLKRGDKSYRFKFGQSVVAEDKEPTLYEVLSCMVKYDPGTFEDFCGYYGYYEFEPSSKKTYKAVVKEWEAMDDMFGDVINEFQEID